MSSDWIVPPRRGPIGLRELLVLHPDPDLFRARRAWLIAAAFFLTGFGLVALIAHFLFRESPQMPIDEPLWAIEIAAFIFTELLFGALGARGGAAALAAYRRRLRLEEIRLTLLRPVTVGQLILHPSPRLVRALVAGCWLGFAVPLLRWRPDAFPHLLPTALIAVNAALTWTSSAWVHMALTLGLQSPLQRLSAAAVLTLVYILGSAIITGLFVLGLFTFMFFDDSSRDTIIMALWVLLIPTFFLLDLFKLVLARAHAARLEQVIFPRLSD